jgi:glycosyltransferase involved in cell wall biosynthesis
VKRVLLFVTDLEVGGTPTVVRELARRLPAAHIACLGRRGPVAEQIEQDSIGVTAFGVGLLQLPAAVRRLRRLVREERIEIVLSFLVHANAVAALARWGGDSITWWQSIQTTQPTPRWHWPVQRFAARRAAGVIVPSEGVADVATRWAGVPRAKVHVLPNGVDATTLADRVRPPRDGNKPLRLVFLGRLDPIKRVPWLVRVVREIDNVRLDIFGDGPDRPSAELAAAGSSAVQFHGTMQREQALAVADALILPSRAEGFGLVLIEAMAAGVPVGAADVPGIRDVVQHDRTGLLFGGQDDDLAAAVQSLRDGPRAAAGRAEAALRDVEERFLWQAIVPQYRRLLNRPPDDAD